MEHRFTITLADLGRSEEAVARVLEAFLERHPEVGPVVSANLDSGELSITWAIEAEDARDAYERSTPVFLESMTASEVPEASPIGVEIVAVEAEEELEEETPPALQPA